MGKILSILTVVIAAATAFLGFVNRGTLVNTKTELGNTQTELATTKSSLEQTKTQLASSEKAKSEMTTKNTESQSEISKLKADGETKDAQVLELKSKITTHETEIEDLKSKVTTITGENEGLKQTIAANQPAAEDDNKNRQAKQQTLNKNLQEDFETAESRISSMQERLTEKTKVEKVRNLTGRILAVNEAWNFVVLNVGDKNGVSSNTELLVKRGNTQIGRVRITSVEPASSIADIVPGSLVRGLSVQPGDYVLSEPVAN